MRPFAHEDGAAAIVVGGLTPLSTTDWPGMLAATVFCQGCAWNCPYCHNAALRPFGAGERPWAEVLAWLETRQGLLEAVVFSGGEPLLQPGLNGAMRHVRGLGFEIGLHTSGMDPQALARVLPLCNWVGLDLKAPRAAYERITGVAAAGHAAWESLGMLRESGVVFELRTTWHPSLLSEAEILELAEEIAAAGPPSWAFQAFQPEGCANAELAAKECLPVPERLVVSLRRVFGRNGKLVVRN
ncbi:MAG: anaerobic ribonucleoside-triphosphate reductase activating protein [Humidesulfovibrio sp.]|uniref:anaerobic ribonucleoside-triphosphate reductase activating protein n=1 Tax=Humidesulfovibrio sp. TaxID=2910988 RepID=UPI0027F9B386|nr:anaerobic ribonucleoside-triphosphate reductase activating protein [Humidesulfovibrio sp.]MDQ7835560.1 anaerobic ribonucleoside-triphosphate reductase activating protein [Humidesulfovibrio sp.]